MSCSTHSECEWRALGYVGPFSMRSHSPVANEYSTDDGAYLRAKKKKKKQSATRGRRALSL